MEEIRRSFENYLAGTSATYASKGTPANSGGIEEKKATISKAKPASPAADGNTERPMLFTNSLSKLKQEHAPKMLTDREADDIGS